MMNLSPDLFIPPLCRPSPKRRRIMTLRCLRSRICCLRRKADDSRSIRFSVRALLAFLCAIHESKYILARLFILYKCWYITRNDHSITMHATRAAMLKRSLVPKIEQDSVRDLPLDSSNGLTELSVAV